MDNIQYYISIILTKLERKIRRIKRLIKLNINIKRGSLK